MKIFKYKFTKVTSGLIYAGMALAVAAFAVNTWSLFAEGVTSAPQIIYPILRYTLIYILYVLLLVVLISLLVSSYYSVDDTTLKTSFGIIKSKFKLENIDNIILDRATKKLAVYFKDGNYMVVVVKEEWYEDFVAALLKGNPQIEYTINSIESDGKDDKKDKK